MRIDRIRLYHVAMPLVYPFRTAYGDDDCIESLFVRMESGDAYGWGETTPWRAPGYSSEWAASAFLLLRDWLAPAVVGKEIGSGDEIQKAMAGFKGNYFAKAGLDLAWWDLHSRSLGQPLWKVLGGGGPKISVGADFGIMETIDGLLAEIGKAAEAGFGRVKLKFRPGWDVDMVAAVREAFPDMPFHIDCNSAYRIGDLPMFQALDEYELVMVEQPLPHDDLIDHARLQRGLKTPVCLDESIISVDRARKAIDTQACGWVNIKPGRVGGLTNAIAIHDLCQAKDMPCWVGGMLESSVGQSFNVALSTLANIKYPCDVFPSERFYRPDIGEVDIALSGPGEITAQKGPGIGVEPEPSRLAAATLQSAVID